MFDLAELERAHEIVGAAMPPTPAHAWPLLAQRLGTSVVVKHENHTPIGAFKVRGGLVLSRPAEARAAGCARHHLGDARQSRPEPRLCGPARRRARDDLCAAWQLGREEPRHARRSAPSWSSMATTFRPRARRRCATASGQGCTWCRRSTATSCWALPPMRSNCSGLRLISTCSMCRSGRAPASAAASSPAICSGGRPRSSACSRPRRRPMRCRSRPARWSTTESSNTLADGMATRIPDAEAFAIIRKGASRIVQVTDDRGRRRDPRLLDRHAQSRRRRRRCGARRGAVRKEQAAGQARRPDPERRQYRF